MTYRNRSRLAYASILLTAVLAAVAAFVGAQSARAGSEVCAPSCVILIEVDGLEAKDVTPQTTPFLWALAHPDAADTGAGPTELDPAGASLTNRAGWIWQAPRGVMSASTASATAALLTGGYPEQDGVPANAFRDSLGPHYFGDGSLAPTTDAVSALVSDQTDAKAAAIVGDSRVDYTLLGLEKEDVWHPEKTDSVPAYCTIPADADTWQAADDPNNPQNADFSCPTPDMNTAQQAYTRLNDVTLGGKVSFGYVYMAELGAIKRLYGDTDGSTVPDPSNAAGDEADRAVFAQLAQTDAAIGYFVSRYAQDQKDKWNNTVLFVAGNHGYESAPIAKRVPDPAAPNDVGAGLTEVVQRVSSGATVANNGTLATVYDSNPAHLKPIRDAILAINAGAPQCHDPNPPCIDEVLYTGADPDHPDDPAHAQTVADRHPSWHLHSVDKDGKPTGADGQLVVVMSPGWSVGQSIPVTTNQAAVDSSYRDGGETIENPYNGSAGGPRNRAIAAIVNGNVSTVKQVDLANGKGRYPVSPANSPQDDEECPKTPTAADGSDDAYWAQNVAPADDANAPGHECQAETVDFAPTIAALLRVSMTDSQLAGRFLQEAFVNQLAFPKEDVELPPPDVDETPPLPEPDIYIPPPPPPPKGFDFDGLYRNLKATVVDTDGCTWQRARPGTKLDYLKIEGDFGKPHAAVTLTFYRKEAVASANRRAKARTTMHLRAESAVSRKSRCQAKAGASRRGAGAPRDLRTRLNAIAHFKPFKLERGHVVLRLKVPDTFRPTHVGILVREARTLDKPGADGLRFEAFGPAAGSIIAIGDGRRLHARKPAKKRAKARKVVPRKRQR